MFDFIKNKFAQSLTQQYNQVVRVMRVGLYEVFQRTLPQEMTKKLTRGQIEVLAAQMVNFLEGEKKGTVYEQVSPEAKAIIPKVIDLIEPGVDKIMDDDSEIRKLVVYGLRVKAVVSFGVKGQTYMVSEEKKRIDKILLKYGKEFPNEAKFEDFSKMVHEFWEKRLQHKWPF